MLDTVLHAVVVYHTKLLRSATHGITTCIYTGISLGPRPSPLRARFDLRGGGGGGGGWDRGHTGIIDTKYVYR